MSWSARVEIPKGTTPEAIPALFDNAEVYGNDDCPDERAVAFGAAVVAAMKIIDSGAAGNFITDTDLVVSLAGHCNPGNKPRAGWSWDTVTVTVSQAHMPAAS